MFNTYKLNVEKDINKDFVGESEIGKTVSGQELTGNDRERRQKG